MITTDIATNDPEVSVTAAPNDRVCVTLEGRGWTLINGVYLTRREVEVLHASITSFLLSNPLPGTELAA